MGSFFTNVQVSTGERAAEEVRAGIVAALRERAREAGLEEDDSLSDEEAERVILIAPLGPEPWIAVYDEVAEGQDHDVLQELGAALSRAGNASVTVLVHDSDVLETHLYRSGVHVDRYNSYPNYGDEDPDKEREPVVGNAPLWQPVLTNGATPASLRAAWETHDTFAEDALARIAKQLGWSEERCMDGFRFRARAHWVMDGGRSPTRVEPDLTGFTRLAFRPSAATAQGRPPLFAEGPPRFVQAAWSPELTVKVGGSETAHASFRNTGGAGQGTQVRGLGSSDRPGARRATDYIRRLAG
jgi:hypothetical protein